LVQRGAQDSEAAAKREQLFSGGGELGARMESVDWASTPLGPVERWPRALRTTIRIVLTSSQPMFVWWGDQLINLYNDAYKSILGGKHPWALGQPASVVWREIWDQIEPRAKSAMERNEGTYDEALPLIMERHGYREETYYTFSYSPVPDDDGSTGGIFCANTDVTQRIIGERQLALLRELAAQTADARSVESACRISACCLESNPFDLPFALIYLFDRERKCAVLAGRSGIATDHPAAPASVMFEEKGLWPLDELRANKSVLIPGILEKVPNLPGGNWSQPPKEAIALPITSSSQTGAAGALIVGLNPHRLFDDEYESFLKLVTGQIGASIANAQAYVAERKRAEALAELDRAKTTFFSNVSHEFRTPLTLMLSPLEQVMRQSPSETFQDTMSLVELAHRNGIRLLKLVNSLLDFSRIEAGRVQGVFQLTDLSSYTRELASIFESVAERAGLKLSINCESVRGETYVDRDMWEKIVLNLLSNAFKFTLDGEIEVRLVDNHNQVQLVLEDSGVGIPSSELPRLFERFHRVEQTRGRSFEGSGIGLALVQELVKLHGGTVAVESALNKGSTFQITIPKGKEHLPADRIEAPRDTVSTALRADAYVEEILSWIPGAPEGASGPVSSLVQPVQVPDEALSDRRLQGVRGSTILLADDNADMREYVRRLLAQYYRVIPVSNGREALEAAISEKPDLILTDVMMPVMDGFALLQQIRGNPETRTIPVVMLSARAGEESRVEGWQEGADDYLVKPFTARELLSRVTAHLHLNYIRKHAEEALSVAEKQAAMGKVAAVLAHEINNPLESVTNILYLLRDDPSLDDRAQELVQMGEKELSRVAHIARQTLGFYRQPNRPTYVSLSNILSEILDVYRDPLQVSKISAERRFSSDGGIRAFPGEVRQIFLNLVSNAIQAMPQGGKLRVHLFPSRNMSRMRKGVRVNIVDTGTGIRPEDKGKLFQPFFTTKAEKGTGIGLWVSRGIVEKMEGSIRGRSVSVRGKIRTCFSVFIPSEVADQADTAA
jgi:signal transduction histidine kinase